MIKKLKDLKEEEIRGKTFFLRVDFNVPVKDGKVVDDYRIVRSLPSIDFLQKNGAKILLFSHIETKDVKPTLRPAYEYLLEQHPLKFVEDCLGAEAKTSVSEMQEGDIILFENVRNYEGEKKNDPEFGKQLASLAEIYVNDAFSVSHRPHATIIGVPQYLPSYAGFQLSDEIEHLNINENTPHPFLFVIGGAKFETKLPLIQKFIDKADNVFVGGALVNDILKAKSLEVGKSLIADVPLDLSAVIANPKLIIPEDVVTKNGDEVKTKIVTEVGKDDVIVDIGEGTISKLKDTINNAKYILWNGPLGNFEIGFKDATISLCKLIGESEAESVVGGGDTLASIQELHLEDQFSFISTGGGAMLEYLLQGTLVGIQALDK